MTNFLLGVVTVFLVCLTLLLALLLDAPDEAEPGMPAERWPRAVPYNYEDDDDVA